MRRLLTALGWLYIAGLLAWLAAHFLLGDRWSWLFALNSLAPYLFLPAPLLIPLALATRKAAFVAGFVAAAVAWSYFWAPLFLHGSAAEQPQGPSIVVAEYNLLGFNSRPEAVVGTIEASGADIIGFQELNPEIARSIVRELSGEYPYQSLDPQVGVHGTGLISKLPFRSSGETIPDDDWVGQPNIVELSLQGTPITLVRFHAASGLAGHAARQRQAHELADYARQHQGPLIVLGDLNATSTNTAYSIIARALSDSWLQKGRGFGNTFPGASASASPGSSRPDFLGLSVPQWLIRIDYVFHSDDWRVYSAKVGPFDGASDHRPVVVGLELRQK